MKEFILSFLSALAVTVLAGIFRGAYTRLRRRRNIHVSTEVRPGRLTKKYGYTQTTVRVMVDNTSREPAIIARLYLMFTDQYGLHIPEQAPDDLEHKTLPAEISPTSNETWYFPAEAVSKSVRALYANKPATDEWSRVVMFARCVLSDGRLFHGRWFWFPTDPDSHYRNPKKLEKVTAWDAVYLGMRKSWTYVVLLLVSSYALAQWIYSSLGTSLLE